MHAVCHFVQVATMTVPAVPDAQILLLHAPSLDPRPFVARLLESSVPDRGVIPWAIDNKYYTADVHFRLEQISEQDDVDDMQAAVIIYIFENAPPTLLPEPLINLMTTNAPEIAIAVRVQSSKSAQATSRHDFEHVFLDLEIDLEDELADADEYDLPALESIRQTLQTHMWPSMVRKQPSTAQTRDLFPVPSTAEAKLEESLDGLSFEDDFADFQSATTRPPAAASASLDPTALLMHLNSVREQLAHVQDEDERRVRAGQEVQKVLADLGLDIDSDDSDM